MSLWYDFLRIPLSGEDIGARKHQSVLRQP